MEKLIQYQKITEIKLPQHVLTIPFYRISGKKIETNLRDISLYYNKESGGYLEKNIKVGGYDISSPAILADLQIDDLD